MTHHNDQTIVMSHPAMQGSVMTVRGGRIVNVRELDRRPVSNKVESLHRAPAMHTVIAMPAMFALAA